MIYFVSLLDHDNMIQGLLGHVRPYLPGLRYLSYEKLFHDQRAPFGHYVFTDIDRLSHYEREAAVAVARALRQADPTVRILNDPQWVVERYPLIRLLQREGINRYSAVRLDDGSRPKRYPVFIRCEDGHHGAETDLLHSEEQLDAALEQMRAEGKVLKRRIAIEYCAERDSDGFYRKYGVINLNGQLIPQHLLRGEDWMIKRAVRSAGQGYAEEELEFIRDNPHADVLDRVFRLARVDFGRVDYGLVDGRVQIFEVNTNPHFPGLSDKADDTPARAERRRITRGRFIDALRNIDAPATKHAPVPFALPHPVYHQMRPWRRRTAAVARYRRWLGRNPRIKRLVPGRFW